MKGYFFDAHVSGLETDGSPIYDRAYQAADHARYFYKFFTTGLFIRPDPGACLVSVSGAAIKTLHVAPGTVMIAGYQGETEGDDSFVVATLDDGFYRVVIRLDRSEDVRAFSCQLLYGSATDYPAPVREGNIYDLCLANVRLESGIPTTLEDTRSDPTLCGYTQFTASPAYYPPSDLPHLLWTYTLFPNTLSPEQIAECENNPSLMSIFRASRIASSFEKKLVKEFQSSDTFNIADYGLSIGDTIDIYLVGGGGGGGNGVYGEIYLAGAYTVGGSGGGGGYARLIRNFVLTEPNYAITVGAGGSGGGGSGGSTSAFGYTVNGGYGGSGNSPGGSGMSGGGGVGGSSSGANGGGNGGTAGSNGFGGDATAGGTAGNIIGFTPVNPYDGISYGCGGGGGAPGVGGRGGGNPARGGGGDASNSNTTGGNAPIGGGGGGGAGAGTKDSTIRGGNGGSGLVMIYA